MRLRFKRWLAPPVFAGDEIKTRRAGHLHSVLMTMTTLILVLLIGDGLGGRTPLPVFGANLPALAGSLFFWNIMRRGRIRTASLGLISMGFILVTASAASLGTIRTPTTSMYLLLVITGGLLFGLRGMIAAAALSSLCVGGLAAAENMALLPPPDYSVTFTQGIAYAAIFFWAGGLFYSALCALQRALARADAENAERMPVHESICANEEKFRNLFDNSLDAVLLTVPDGRILAANAAAIEMFGRTEKAFCGLGRNGMMDLSDPRLTAAVKERNRTGTFRGEITALRKGGRKFRSKSRQGFPSLPKENGGRA